MNNTTRQTLGAIDDWKATTRQGALGGKFANAPSGAVLSRKGNDPAPALGGGPASTPSPANSGREQAPVSQPRSPGGGVDLRGKAGTPREMADSVKPADSLAIATQSAGAVSSSGKTKEIPYEKREKAKVAKQMEQITGQPPKKTIQELQQQEIAKLDAAYKAGDIPKKQYKGLKEGWKNIFNIIPEEDFGLFLFDFGLRLMMHAGSGQFTTGGSIGAAGMGALQGHMARQTAEQEGALARQQTGMEMGLGAYEAETGRMRAENERMEAEQKSAADTISTDNGIWQWNPKTERYDIQLKDAKGNVLKPTALTGRPSTKQWEVQFLMDALDLSEQEAARRVFSGIDPNNVRMMAEERWSRFMNDSDAVLETPNEILEQRRIKRMTGPEVAKKKQEFIQSTLQQFGYTEGGGALTTNSGSGGALPDTDAKAKELGIDRAKVESEYGKKMTPQEWAQYVQIQAELQEN